MNIRQYSAVDEIQASVKTHLKTHQKKYLIEKWCHETSSLENIVKSIRVPDIKFEDLTVGDVWGLNITLNSKQLMPWSSKPIVKNY